MDTHPVIFFLFCAALSLAVTETMTTVVPTSEEDAALSVVRFASELAWADAGPEVFSFLCPKPFLSSICQRFGYLFCFASFFFFGFGLTFFLEC